jgi:hypothetical protein
VAQDTAVIELCKHGKECLGSVIGEGLLLSHDGLAAWRYITCTGVLEG